MQQNIGNNTVENTSADSSTVVRIAMADDHAMLRKGLANLIESFGDYKVVLQASNGKELIDRLNPALLPHIVLLDINMPIMNGYDTAIYLQKNYPRILVLAISMMDDEQAIILMLKAGAKGYILKDAEPSELRQAMHDVVAKGYYYSDLVTGKLIYQINQKGKNDLAAPSLENLSPKELEFLKYATKELSYKEIAEKMNVSPRTVDGYRDALFEKLLVKTRVGLAMYAVKQGLAI